jgi:hypothetical protein
MSVKQCLKEGNYIEAIEKLKELQEWTDDSLQDMAEAERKLHNYQSAYSYYILASKYGDANSMLCKVSKTELESKYGEYIHPNVRIWRVNGRRGVIATKDMSEGDEVCKIPLYLCIGGTMRERMDYLLESNIYTRSLPVSSNFPVLWSPNTCEEIAPSPMRLILEEKIIEWKKEFVTDKAMYQRSLIGSRCFSNNGDYLVPFADMLNHSNEANVDWEFTEDHFVMRTTRPVKAHEELLDFYGPKSNYESFVHYGFVQENNTKLDVVRVIADLPDKVAKTRLDPRYFDKSFEFELRGSYMEGTVEIFSFLRYIRSNEKRCPETLKGFLRKPISKENELWVCKMLFNILQKDVHRRVKHCRVETPLAIALLQSEMKVLVHWGEVLQRAIRIMEDNDKKALKQESNDYLVKVIKAKNYYK